MHRRDLNGLDASRAYWVPAVVAPYRDWQGAPGCRRGARFMVDDRTFHPSREEFGLFDSQAECLRWIMAHRMELNHAMPEARIRAVRLDEWLLGLA